jgi:NADPH-dependent 2,4-dienoyl-CoA reductase/sulfur reductase-like enzyme/pSer/pThr/pTyr-binding forkhead associated (FHA) protein
MVERMASASAKATYVIVGNGIAGVTAAEILRQEDSAANIIVIADDPFPVYYRPALKDYLAGRVREDKLWARPTSFYQDHNIHFMKDRVVGIQAGQHTIQLQSGRQGQYTRLLLASGARSISLQCPGADLIGVATLRTVADYQAVLQRLPRVRRIVVSGSGTLALETVETLRHRGYQVVHLVRRRTLWSEVLDATASDLVLQQERRDGVEVHLEEEIVEIVGDQGEVCGVRTNAGQQIDCEMVIAAIGVEPIIDFIKTSGIGCGRGVRVDAKMRTNAPDIYAAGDVLETTDTLTRRTRIIGQWYPAIQQARAAAYSMLDLLDNNQPFNASTFYNATTLYGLDFASVGLTNVLGFQELLAEPKPKTYRKVLLRDGVPVGLLALGDRKQALAFKRAIDHAVNLLPISANLFTDDFNLQSWLDSQGVPSARLGVNREGDAAIKQATNTDTKARTVERKPSTTEAHLVPLENSLNLELPELRLSQTNVLTVGRQVGVHLLIDENTVSRRHAELRYANEQYVVHDLGSTNGTYINGERLNAHSVYVLKPDDEVRFGKVVRFAFVLRTVPDQVKRTSSGAVTMVGVTHLQDMSLKTGALGQPVLNADGSLLLPEASNAVPAAVVAKFKEQPALIILNGSGDQEKGRPPLVYMLRIGKHTRLGRDKENDIDLADIVISRQHAEIFPGPGGFYIRDLQSSNGVIVNQTKIDNPYRLSHGDRIVLGSSLIYFVDLHTNVGPDQSRPAAAPFDRSQLVVAEGTATAKKVAVRGPLAPQPNLKICARCGTPNGSSARFCAGCSAPLG